MVTKAPIYYPESDGKPMAENTLQFQWITTMQGNLDSMFKDRADVFVAGDNFIYPKEGAVKIVLAPDVYVAFGRPKGHRPSYKVWEEGGIFPQVIIEVLSPKNDAREMANKLRFYQKWGAEEYYVINPDPGGDVQIYTRVGKKLVAVLDVAKFTSPLLGIRFQQVSQEWVVWDSSGKKFDTFVETKSRVAELESRAEQLAEMLRKLGVKPEDIP